MNGSEPRALSLVERYALPPAEIERRSLALVDAALADRFADAGERAVAGRVVYAAGDLGLAERLRFQGRAVRAAVDALRAGCSIVVDVRMVAAALDRARLERLGSELVCAIDLPGVEALARELGVTRAIAGVRLAESRLDGAVIAIGNAPTALLALLDLIDAGTVRPACVIGMPVGFVAAAEAKAELARRGVPAIAVAGTRGGSPLAAAAVNALLRLALDAASPAATASRSGGAP
ncbi:MAG TPA: precorrin-8X methylmutase [Dehalococcoidia bacterium]|nr:precorrin-8X methylmutase [Dehalococcoidia bacterium]